MAVFQKLWQNKQARSSMITAALSFILMISLLVATVQVTAWFKNRHILQTPAAITNFEHIVEYQENGKWVSVDPGEAIPVQIRDGKVQPVTLQLQHTGLSSSYIRVSAFGHCSNADTGTVLPLSSTELWDLEPTADSGWVRNDIDSCLYYAEDFYNYAPDVFIGDYEDLKPTGTFTVSVNVENISPHQDYIGELYVIVDAVQPDRYQELWGISELPVTPS